MPTLAPPERHRRALCSLLFLLALGVFVFPAASRVSAASSAAVVQAESEHSSGTGEAEAGGGWSKTLAKAVNFAALVGLLAYFLKTPIAGYLNSRSEAIRHDLVAAAKLRTDAEAQLADVSRKLAALPAELEALERRGREELANERTRLADATAREKQRLLDRTRREIDLRFRVARRELTAHTAELAMRLARARVERDITPDDQTRLIDRYAAEVRA